jgi:DNA polymerase III epsilon subunit family exonuclease
MTSLNPETMKLEQLTPSVLDGLPADGPVIVIDTETTGLDHRTEKMIEIAALRLENGEITDRFHTLVNPEQPIRGSSFRIHHISEAMVEDAPNIETVLPDLLKFLGDLPLVAHNAVFDYSFVNEACKKHLGHRLPNTRLCTLELYRSVFPEEVSHGLSALLKRFGYESFVSHRAMDDAEQLAKVYPKLRELYSQKNQWQLNQLNQVPYLFERYLRLQRTQQLLHAELQDLKELFKLHFMEGGASVTASTGDLLSMGYRRSYLYDTEALTDTLKELGLLERASKVNPRAVDRLLAQRNPLTSELTEEQRDALLKTRMDMHQSLLVQITKPVAAEEETEGDVAEVVSIEPAVTE